MCMCKCTYIWTCSCVCVCGDWCVSSSISHLLEMGISHWAQSLLIWVDGLTRKLWRWIFLPLPPSAGLQLCITVTSSLNANAGDGLYLPTSPDEPSPQPETWISSELDNSVCSGDYSSISKCYDKGTENARKIKGGAPQFIVKGKKGCDSCCLEQ